MRERRMEGETPWVGSDGVLGGPTCENPKENWQWGRRSYEVRCCWGRTGINVISFDKPI